MEKENPSQLLMEVERDYRQEFFSCCGGPIPGMGGSFSLIKNIQVKAFVKPALVTMINGQERLFEFSW